MGVYLAVALGGAAGSISRFGIDQAIERRSFAVFPWATFTINMSGCLMIGGCCGRFDISNIVDTMQARWEARCR